ncbi:hypothetical protein AN2702.2 [Aspergillus nidulans FGSC A4]|nr:hypothetical protein AN2702.2 [Aspergillus nidulans FGSC A4]|eukprot:XP_660306.1 hypothetical protein AN2702.2 [Aspergillus nidulans FGSC A4]
MKPTLALLSLSALPLATAWELTWRDSSGKAATEEGTGPSECININMLLFKNDKCEGEPAGMATESFAKEASVDLKGFQVVEYGSSETGSGNATTTKTTTDGDADGTVTLPTVSSTSTSTSTDDEDGDDNEDEDGTVTLPTVSATTTATTTDESSTAEPTTTTAMESGSDSETSSTEPTSTESAGAEEPTPTGASSRLAPISLAGLAAVVLGAVAGGF